MLCACTLAIALLLGRPPQQDSTEKPSSPSNQAPPQSDTTQPQAPQSQPPSKHDQSQTAPGQAQPAQNDTAEKPKETEEKKSSPCTDQDKSKCGVRVSKPRRVVRHGSTGEPTAQLAPGMTPEQALHHRQATEQLLSSTEGNLLQLAKRNLNQGQQDTVSQIRNYMAGSRSALQDGDLPRARTLASKAHLLVDDLLRH
jgi:hypothetical protein